MTQNEVTTVGILYPGLSAEDEYPRLERMLGNMRLPLIHTELDSDAHTIEAMGAAGDEAVLAAGARELSGQALDAIMWACTSGSFAFGWEAAQEQADKLQAVAGVPASSTSFAFTAAVKHLGVNDVAIAATYPNDLARMFTEFLQHEGVNVLGLLSNDVTSATDAGNTGKDAVFGFAEAAATQYPEAQAILIPDTALHSVEWLDELENRTGKLVLTANQVTAWHGLRLAGDTRTREGLGTLFRTA
jgi:maleate cis-trans isomerase